MPLNQPKLKKKVYRQLQGYDSEILDNVDLP